MDSLTEVGETNDQINDTLFQEVFSHACDMNFKGMNTFSD